MTYVNQSGEWLYTAEFAKLDICKSTTCGVNQHLDAFALGVLYLLCTYKMLISNLLK